MIKRLFELRKIYSLLDKDRNKNSSLTRMMFAESIFITTWQGKENFLQSISNKKINMKKLGTIKITLSIENDTTY